ncbi:MAG: ABC transporter substrate-binding protein [bacterium]|nr:ABC transporter substrate-binding protein [bacterium]
MLQESYRSFTPLERALFYLASILFLVSGIGTGVLYAATHTIRVPASGGSYTEAIVGGPRFINPALAPANDADRDLVRLIYSGLTRYNDTGIIVPDLADSYTVSTDSRTFVFSLRDNVKWHDGIPLTADDVAFTVHLIQNPEYQSPLRFAWQGVKVEKKDDYTIAFILPSPYISFLSHTAVGILPKHLWQDVSSQAFSLSDLNLKPVGSGPFRFKEFVREKDGIVVSITLESNKSYYRRPPYLDRLIMRFFESRDEAIGAIAKGDAEGMGFVSSDDLASFGPQKFAIHALHIPRIFSVFFNQNQSKVLAQKTVREALEFATDRQQIKEGAYSGYADIVHGPMPPSVLGYTPDVTKREYDKNKATTILEKAGWKLNAEGVRELKETKKEEQVVKNKKVLRDVVVTTTLEFSLLTANLPELEKSAELLKTQWEAAGARVDVEIAGVADIQGERVRPRQYDAVLFGYVLGLDPDPYSFWHSSQRRDPGLNLSLYQNPKVDRILEEVRQTSDEAGRKKKLADFQKMVSDDIPALFLVSPDYLYVVLPHIKNINTGIIANPAERFGNAEDWYVKTKREWR